MFTGIIEELGTVETAGARLAVRCSKVMEDLTEGASIAVNGVCLTATGLGPDRFSADLAPETLRRSNLGSLRAGSKVNLERPLAPTGRLSGHIVQGHVDGTGTVTRLEASGQDHIVGVSLPPEIHRLCVDKGSLTLDGISLTIAECVAIPVSVAEPGATDSTG